MREIGIRRPTSPGNNVRRAGGDIRKGQVILTSGTVLRAAHIGVLATLGRATVEVVRRPVVAILTSGDELLEPGEPLADGKIYDANTYTLFLISVIPDYPRMRERTGHYVGGILAGVAYAVPSLLLLNRVLHLQMLVALVALGEFVASYLAQSKGNIRFVGIEMGMIFPLLLVLPLDTAQSPYTTLYNIIALFTYTLIAVVVGRAWVALGLEPDRTTEPAGAAGARGG